MGEQSGGEGGGYGGLHFLGSPVAGEPSALRAPFIFDCDIF